MKYLSLFLLLLSTMSYGARFKSGVANECKRPKVSVDYSTLPKTSKDYEHCLHLFKETGKKCAASILALLIVTMNVNHQSR